MSKEIIYTTDTDGFHRTTMVSDSTKDLLANVLKVEIKDGEDIKVILVNNNVEIPEDITKINGLTKEILDKHGSSPEDAGKILSMLIEDGDTLITHTSKFHKTSLAILYHAAGLEMPNVKFKCLNKDMVDICKIPHEGTEPEEGQYKFPTLKELRIHYNVPVELDKIDSLSMIWDCVKSEDRSEQEEG